MAKICSLLRNAVKLNIFTVVMVVLACKQTLMRKGG